MGMGTTSPSPALIGSGGASSIQHLIYGGIPGPYVTLVEILDRTTIRVTFSEAVYGADLLVASAWTLTAMDGLSDCYIVSAAATADPAVYTLTVRPLTHGGYYRATAPAAAASILGIPLGTPAYGEDAYDAVLIPEPVEDLLTAFVATMGDSLSQMTGRPRTRLRTVLGPDDTDIEVESTLDFPDENGIIYIKGEKITYTTKDHRTFYDVVRPSVVDPYSIPPNQSVNLAYEDYPVNTEVVGAIPYGRSQLAQARDDTLLNRADETMLLFHGRDRGFPRPIWAMTEENMRDYLKHQWYLDRLNWWSLFRVLKAMFGWVASSGTGSISVTAGYKILYTDSGPSADTSDTPHYHDRWVIVDGVLCRVMNAWPSGSGVAMRLEPNAGPFWEGTDDLAIGAGHEWELMPFNITPRMEWWEGGSPDPTQPDRAASIKIWLYTAEDGAPLSYLCASALIAGNDSGRPYGAQLLPGATTSGSLYHPLYLMNPYYKAVSGVLQEILPAGTYIEITRLGHY